MKRTLTVLGLGMVACAVNAQIVINEIRIDQPGSDNQEYFELAGAAGASLNTLTYLVIGDGTGGSGVIEAVIDLTGQSLAADGHFLGVESTWNTSPPGLWPGGTPDFDFGSALNFENSDNVTHVLVQGFSGLNGDDLDTNDDGVLDVTPWTSVLDAVGMIEEPNPPTATEYSYGAALGFVDIGPDGGFVPGHIYRLDDTTGPWQIGVFDGSSSGWNDTPGASNNPVPEPATLVALGLGAVAILRRRK